MLIRLNRTYWLILSLITIHSTMFGQELLCNVQIVTQQIQGTNKQVFQTMQNVIYEFMNNTSWTNHVFDMDERIECNMVFNLKEMIGADEFKGSLQVQATRPVYNSSYNTITFFYMDEDLHFTYEEFQPLEFSLSGHDQSNLTSLLAFYAYIILGLDYDSYAANGGVPFFENAEKIVTNAQNAIHSGWRAMDDQKRHNRYWLINNILSPEFSPAREFYYSYHRLGLDKMESKPAEGRSDILNSIRLLQKLYRNKPDPFMHFLEVIYDTKSNEFANIFSEGPPEERNRAYAILTEINPANKNKYDQILK